MTSSNTSQARGAVVTRRGGGPQGHHNRAPDLSEFDFANFLSTVRLPGIPRGLRDLMQSGQLLLREFHPRIGPAPLRSRGEQAQIQAYPDAESTAPRQTQDYRSVRLTTSSSTQALGGGLETQGQLPISPPASHPVTVTPVQTGQQRRDPHIIGPPASQSDRRDPSEVPARIVTSGLRSARDNASQQSQPPVPVSVRAVSPPAPQPQSTSQSHGAWNNTSVTGLRPAPGPARDNASPPSQPVTDPPVPQPQQRRDPPIISPPAPQPQPPPLRRGSASSETEVSARNNTSVTGLREQLAPMTRAAAQRIREALVEPEPQPVGNKLSDEIGFRPRGRGNWRISVLVNAIGILLPLTAFGVLSAENSAIFKIYPSRYLQTLPLDDVPFVDGPSVIISYFSSCGRKMLGDPFSCFNTFFFPRFDPTILPAEAPQYLITSPPNFPQFFFAIAIFTTIFSRILRLVADLRLWDKNNISHFVLRPLHMTAFWLGAISFTISLPPLLIIYVWHTLNARHFNFAVNEMGLDGPPLFAETGPGIVWLSVCLVILFICLVLDVYDVPKKTYEHLIALIDDLTDSARELASLDWTKENIEEVSSGLDADIKELLSGLTIRNTGRKRLRLDAMQREFEQLFVTNRTNELIELYDMAINQLNHGAWDIRIERALRRVQEEFGTIQAVKELKERTETVFRETRNKILELQASRTREPRKKEEEEEEEKPPVVKVKKKEAPPRAQFAMPTEIHLHAGQAPPLTYAPPMMYPPQMMYAPPPAYPLPPAYAPPPSAPVPAPEAKEDKKVEEPPKRHPDPVPVQVAQRKERCVIQ